jgi:superoxide dismutase
MVPILAIDVYEHAYVRDFGATPDGRKQYVEAFFRNVNWEHVNRQVIQAEAAKRGADDSGAREPQPAGAHT